jgi:hypothetical protein
MTRMKEGRKIIPPVTTCKGPLALCVGRHAIPQASLRSEEKRKPSSK